MADKKVIEEKDLLWIYDYVENGKDKSIYIGWDSTNMIVYIKAIGEKSKKIGFTSSGYHISGQSLLNDLHRRYFFSNIKDIHKSKTIKGIESFVEKCVIAKEEFNKISKWKK